MKYKLRDFFDFDLPDNIPLSWDGYALWPANTFAITCIFRGNCGVLFFFQTDNMINIKWSEN